MQPQDLVEAIDQAVLRLMNDHNLKDSAIAKIVLASIAKAHEDRAENPCAYCNCSFPCRAARSNPYGDWR